MGDGERGNKRTGVRVRVLAVLLRRGRALGVLALGVLRVCVLVRRVQRRRVVVRVVAIALQVKYQQAFPICKSSI